MRGLRWFLRLYPSVWRDRYEEEMLAVLEDHRITLATVFDLLIGVVDANLNYDGVTGGMMNMVNRLRSGVVMIFCAFMLFGTGWCLLQRITDPMPTFQQAAQSFPAFWLLFDAILVVGCLAFLAFLIGGLPLVFVSVKRAIASKKGDVLKRFGIAVACLCVLAIATVILALWHPQIYFLLGYLILAAILLTVGTVSVSQMIARTEFHLEELKFVFIPEVVILFGMIVSVILSTILLILITAHAPRLFDTQDVGIPLFIAGVTFMALGTIFASMGLRRGSVKRSRY